MTHADAFVSETTVFESGSISFFTLWNWRTLQRAEYALRIAGDHRQIGASRLIGSAALSVRCANVDEARRLGMT
jgi:hypothetical protein